jgi:hypothetical protein
MGYRGHQALPSFLQEKLGRASFFMRLDFKVGCEYNTDVKINRPPWAVFKTKQNNYEFYRKNKTIF